VPAGGRRAPEEVTALWLSHHWPDDYDRCATVAGRNVCRRCLVLYPVALVVMVAALSGLTWPSSWDAILLVLLPLPAVVELCGEQLAGWTYRPRRQVAVTVLLAVGLGKGFARYVERPGDALFWAVVVGYTAVCLGAVVHRLRHPLGAE
jgi:hypothetical protein